MEVIEKSANGVATSEERYEVDGARAECRIIFHLGIDGDRRLGRGRCRVATRHNLRCCDATKRYSGIDLRKHTTVNTRCSMIVAKVTKIYQTIEGVLPLRW